MKSTFTRRSFLKSTALGAAAVGALPLPAIFAAGSPGERLRCALIGCGGRGMNHLDWFAGTSKELLVAIVDPDEKRHAAVKKWLQSRQIAAEDLQVFTDYRQMFDKLGKSVDAVFIATPNHQHAGPSILAMEHGMGVFCEKPLTHSIGEARKLREMAARSKAPTQMGNQGHCEEGYRRLVEFIQAGVIGKVTETHSWTDRANGGIGPRPPVTSPPAGMNWDSWIGPAPYRDFHDDLHPHEWHGWFDFGNGSIGNMGCHVLDGAYWALNLDHPTTIECQELRGGSGERYPLGSRILWEFPARGAMPPAKVYWYEGLNQQTAEGASGTLRQARGDARNLPPHFKELLAKYPDEEFDSNGTFYVGDKGIIYTATYGGRMHVVPLEKNQDLAQSVPKTLPRPKGKNVMDDFIRACKAGEKETAASFDYGARLTEFTLLGNLAQHAGVGKKIEWDGKRMVVKNLKELNKWVSRKPRQGWPG